MYFTKVQTIETFKETLKDCKTIIWNGPMGVCEFEKFSRSSK